MVRRGLVVVLVTVALGCVLAAASGCGGSKAVAQPSHTPSLASTASQVLPRVVGVAPSRMLGGAWGQGSALVLYRPGGSPLVAGRCRLTIDGQRVAAQAIDARYANGRVIQFFWTTYRPPTGKLRFGVVLVTRAGQSVAHEWTYENPGGGSH